ncbi:MAG: YciI family protein [Thermoplasmata archaeon]|jgi:uncharacterized protein YciI|nr:YciI family protein [Thermoplasmata archaeon]
MEFDTFTLVLLERQPDAPPLDEAATNQLQDAHMDHLAALQEAGSLLAAGPFLDPYDPKLRGLGVLRLPLEETRALLAADPAVRAGQLSFRLLTWMVPKGAVRFDPVRFPHSQAEL